MPDYSFGATGQLQELLDTIKQAQQNQKPQEPPTPAQIATEATMQGVNANNAAYAQQQAQAAAAQQAAQAQALQQQQLMNPAQWHYGKQMLGYKNAYENADTLAKALNPTVTDEAQLGVAADALRGLAHKNADNIRQIAKDAGIDLSGIEDVGYEDAQRNMLTRQTKEIADILSGRGKYGKNSDQYFDDEYMKLIGEGRSANDAKRIAGQRAQRYQADRVTYLRNAYNMYGRDGNYTNEYGVPILQEIAMEMPEVANVYAQAYKLPTAAQDRANTLEGKAVDQANQLEQLGITHGYNVDMENLRHKHGAQMADLQNALSKNAFSYQHDYLQGMKEYEEARRLRLAEQEGRAIGFEGDDLKTYIAARMGINMPRKVGTGKDTRLEFDKQSVENLKILDESLDKQEKNILSQLKVEEGNVLSEKDTAELNQALQYVRYQRAMIQQALSGIAGIGGVGDKNEGNEPDDNVGFTGNWNNDGQIVAKIREAMQAKGYSTDQIKRFVALQLQKAGYTEEAAKQAAGID